MLLPVSNWLVQGTKLERDAPAAIPADMAMQDVTVAKTKW